jgi:hypothetical protein
MPVEALFTIREARGSPVKFEMCPKRLRQALSAITA